jgi:Raf kinase inhibitor-like YbhB/YbcL family protein
MRLLPIFAALALSAAGPALAMTLDSQDIRAGDVIPPLHVYTRCGGRNVSPQLSWTAPPATARSLVLTMIDMDVKPALWSHWIIVGLPPVAATMARGFKDLAAGSHAVVSNFGEARYDGPCPPPGSGVHRYQFTIWAMPTANVAIRPDAKAAALMRRLLATSVDHASVEGTVAAKP